MLTTDDDVDDRYHVRDPPRKGGVASTPYLQATSGGISLVPDGGAIIGAVYTCDIRRAKGTFTTADSLAIIE